MHGDGQFSTPHGICIKGDVLYVADYGNHRVQKLTSRGEFLHKFGQLGSGQGQFNGPSAIIVDSNNRLIVSDRGNHRIQIFNEVGGWLLTIDGKCSGNSCFWHPRGLALDPQGNIHVAALGSTDIKVFTKEGEYVMSGMDIVSPSMILKETKSTQCMGDLKNPWGTALDPRRDGSVYVVKFGDNTILKYCN